MSSTDSKDAGIVNSSLKEWRISKMSEEDSSNHTSDSQITSIVESNQSSELTVHKVPKVSRKLHHELIEWRRSSTLTLIAQGKTQKEISEILKVAESTVSKDLKTLRRLARENLSQQIEEVLPFQHQLRIAQVDKVI